MHRVTPWGPLEDKRARSLRVVGVFLDKGRACQTSYNISGGQPIFGQFVVPMLRDAHFLAGNQLLQSVKDAAHIAMLPLASQQGNRHPVCLFRRTIFTEPRESRALKTRGSLVALE
jgi:hypothetical protein